MKFVLAVLAFAVFVTVFAKPQEPKKAPSKFKTTKGPAIGWASDGCPKQNTKKVPTGARELVSKAAVRCCSKDGNKCKSFCKHKAVTYDAAEHVCNENAMRLCKRKELETNVCCGTGCQFDGYLVWEQQEKRKD